MENQKHKIKPIILLKKSLMALTVIILVIQLGIVCINSFKARRNCELNVHRDTTHTFHIIQERERRNKRGLEEGMIMDQTEIIQGILQSIFSFLFLKLIHFSSSFFL